MTLGYFMFSLGAMFLYSAITNTPIRNLILGIPGPGQPDPIVTGSTPASSGATTSKLSGKGVGHYGGKRVCQKFIPVLKQARRDGWRGGILSGVRTREGSIQACRDMCGQDTCSGNQGACAGANSNHNGCNPGAIDVSDPQGFERAMRKRGYPLRNAVAGDPVHYSESGH